MTKILENNKAAATATAAMISDHAKAQQASVDYSAAALTSVIYMICFLADFGASNNKACKAYEAALEAEGVTVTNDKASGFVASYKRQRPIAKHSKVRKLVEECTSVDGVRNTLVEAGYTSIGKLQAFTAKPLAKLSVKGRAACDAMMAADAVKTFLATMDGDQVGAFERSIENVIRNGDATHVANVKSETKAELKRRMKAAADKKAAAA